MKDVQEEGRGIKGFNPLIALIKASSIVLLLLAVIFTIAKINGFRVSSVRNDLKTAHSKAEKGSSEKPTKPSKEPEYFNPRVNKSKDLDSTRDPAAEIQKYVWGYRDKSTPWLDDIDEFKRGVGDFARVQEWMLHDRSKSRYYPSIVIGDGEFTNEECNVEGGTLGMYHGKCESILVNFRTKSLVYEHPIEVLTTLAHEYAHHLTNITVGNQNISGLEAELIADCFAGVMHGYWAKWNKLTEEEFNHAGRMMIQVSKSENSMLDEHGDQGQRLGAFLAGKARADGKITTLYRNFCIGLDEVISFSKGFHRASQAIKA